MEYLVGLSRNIRLIRLWSASAWILGHMAVAIVYFSTRGVSLTEFFLMLSVFSTAIVILEVPSGYLADRWSRKGTICLGTALCAVGVGMQALALPYWMYIASMAIFGAGASFNSGAYQALLYDTLLELHREDEYVRVSGSVSRDGRFAEAFGAIVGGLLASMALVYAYYLTFVAFLVAIGFMALVTEPYRSKASGPHWSELRQSVRTITHQPMLLWVVLLAIFTALATRSSAWLYQPLFVSFSVPTASFGYFWAATLVISGLSSMLAHKLDGRNNRIYLYGLTVAVLGIGALLIGLNIVWAVIAGITLIQIGRGFYVFTQDDIQKRVSSERRATVFSLKNSVHHLVFAGIGPFLAIISETSVALGFLTISVGIALVGGICIAALGILAFQEQK